jgi:hypothetical protein
LLSESAEEAEGLLETGGEGRIRAASKLLADLGRTVLWYKILA